MFLLPYTNRQLSEKKGRKEIIPSKHLKKDYGYYIIVKKSCQVLKMKKALALQGFFVLFFVCVVCGFVKL